MRDTPLRCFLMLVLALGLGGTASAQGTLAKLQFEEAEKAYLAKDHAGALTRLKALEDQGLKNPRVLHLKILATDAQESAQSLAWFQNHAQHKGRRTPAEVERQFDEMLAFKRDVQHYLKHYDIAGLEDKFRDVFQVAERRKTMFDAGWFASNVARTHFEHKGYDQALAWYRKAQDLGGFEREDLLLSTKYFQLGYLHGSTPGPGRDPAEALRWYGKAVERGSTAAMNNLALLLRDGKGVDKDVDRAIGLFTRAAEAGNVKGATNLAATYGDPAHGRADPAQEAAWLTRAAEKGDMFSMYQVAMMHADGRQLPRDTTKALDWLHKAATAGHAMAAARLGDVALFGLHGQPRDLEAARRWFAKAPGHDHYALMLYEGLGGPADHAAARDFLARPSGVERAFHRALLRFAGKGEPKDEAGAAEQFLATHSGYFAPGAQVGHWKPDFKRSLGPDQWRGQTFPGYAADALAFIEYLNRTRQLNW